MDVFALTRKLIDIDSTTGREKDVALFLKGYLAERGFQVTLQEVEPDRFNVLARLGQPRAILSTHLDTVPPFIPSSEDEDYLYGRGACDAKGIAAAQITAAERLADGGVEQIGLLFVVDEERTSLGAKAANRLDWESEFLIDGEPTENKLVLATKGSMRVEIKTRGRAAHSAYPHMGESAIEKLLDVLDDLRQIPLPRHELLGESNYNIGIIAGGVASNVIPDRARAEVMFRLVEEPVTLRRQLQEITDGRATLTIISEASPVFLNQVEGFETGVVSFGTDIPFLTRLGKPYLLGPGSILDAHTDHEKVPKRALIEAVELYVRLVERLLNESG
ncbi:MAG: M20/M25/M40 family metallo-hydrolase [Acidobacteria bacterium]|nr:MAG: M20/M25/M40 family metallo-hydrolase [Acidobacteriota bacterium]